jgi:hypothetical protein
MLRVPVARDGSMFAPDLQRSKGYWVGAKGNETMVPDFLDALATLKQMPLARWRRPNAKGNWGIVSAADWVEIEVDQGEIKSTDLI